VDSVNPSEAGHWGSEGDWAACGPCAALVEADRWDDLRERVASAISQRQRGAVMSGDRLAMIQQVHAEFRRLRTGTRVLLPPPPPPPVTMASVYSRALDLQADLLSWLATDILAQTAITESRQNTEIMALITQSLVEADVGYVGRTVCSLLEQTASDIPDVRLQAADLLVPNGFLLYEQAWSLPTVQVDGQLPFGPVKALSWISLPIAETSTDLDGGILLFPWLEQWGSARRLMPLNAAEWGFGMTLDEASVRRRSEPERVVSRAVLRHLAALNAFIAQRLITGRRGPPERAVRRRLERAGREAPDVLVVELRRTEAQHDTEPSGRTIAADFCFPVSGHWRRAWFDSIQDHRPIWINPYLKGNLSGPLRKRKRVFAIVH